MDEENENVLLSVDETIEYKCGWMWFKPDWLQRFRTPVWSLIFISCGAFLQGAVVNGLLHLMIPTIEHRFNLRSIDSGMVSGGYDIASLLCLIPVTYFGGRPTACKPVWIGTGIIVMGIGSLIFASPHFISNPLYVKNEGVNSNLCDAARPELQQICPKNEEIKLSTYMWLLFLGNLLHGAGASPLYTLGVTYIDESVVRRKTGIFLGMYYAAATLGVAVGYIVGGLFLQLNEGFLSKEKLTDLRPLDSIWVGAWWLGFVLLGSLCMVVAIPILFLPTQLPDWKKVKSTKVSETIVGQERTEAYSKLSQLPSAIYELLRNTNFVLLNFAGCCEGVIFSGSGAFIPKIIQNQFHLSHKTTALVMGIITVPSAILGTMVGGGILKKFDLQFVGTLKLCVAMTILSMLFSTCFLIICSTEKVVGINIPYYSDRKEIKLEDPCNEICRCSEKNFMPICGVNNYIYFSPCHAGCQEGFTATIPDVTLYSNCSCIEQQLDNGIQASSQSCKHHCTYLPLFLIMMYLSLFCTFVAVMPAVTATLRCVKSDQRSLALGVQWMLVRLLGMIPGPMLFGIILDGTCEYWHASCSHLEGSCVLYDHYAISRSMVLLACGWKSLEIVLFSLSIYFYKKDRTKS